MYTYYKLRQALGQTLLLVGAAQLSYVEAVFIIN